MSRVLPVTEYTIIKVFPKRLAKGEAGLAGPEEAECRETASFGVWARDASGDARARARARVRERERAGVRASDSVRARAEARSEGRGGTEAAGAAAKAGPDGLMGLASA
jgi:hypothetical protein